MSREGTHSHGGLASLIVLVLGTAVALFAPAARADVINLGACNTSALTQPFATWGDSVSYELAPGGDFEQASWTLSGGAQRVSGNEPYAATGILGNWSLSLPAGSSAKSPPTCVDAGYPTVRFFIAGTGTIAVTVVDGGLDIPAGVAVAGPKWMPTPVMLTSAAVLGAFSGGTAQVSIRITALTGDPQVDDIYVDPWCRG